MSHSGTIIKHFVLVIVFTLVIILRIEPSYYSAIFAGENFHYILLGSLEYPPRLFAPVLDGYFFMSRLFAAIAALISTEHMHIISLILGAIFHAYSGTYIIRDEYEWLIKRLSIRIVLAVIITLGPGMHEIIGSPVCVSYSATWLLIVLMLKPYVLVNKLDQFKFILCAISTNFLIVLLPIVLIRWYFSKAIVYVYILIAIIVYSLICIFLTLHGNFPFITVDIFSLDKISIEGLVNLALSFFDKLVFVGHGASAKLSILVCILGFLSLVCIIEGQYKKTANYEVALGLLLTSFFFCFLHSIGRAYDLTFFSGRHGLMTITPIIFGMTIIIESNYRCLIHSTKIRVAFEMVLVMVCIHSLYLDGKISYTDQNLDLKRFKCDFIKYKDAECSNLILENRRYLIANGILDCTLEEKSYRCKGIDQFGAVINYKLPDLKKIN